MQLINFLKSLSHHAYLLIGNDSTRTELISILEKKHKVKTHGNADFFDLTYVTFTIDNARELKELAGTKPMSEKGSKIFILTMNGITVEAQNALLKLLEEPPQYAHFFLIIPSTHLLLPTVKSRLSLVGDTHTETGKDSETLKEAKRFVKASPAERLEIVKSLMDAISKEKKSKQDAIDLLNDIESEVYKENGAKEAKKALEAIDTARKYLSDRAPSVKMLLEYVALNI